MDDQHGLGVENAVVLEGVDSVVEEHASRKLDLRGVSEKTGLEKKLAEVSGEVDRLKHELEEKDRELVDAVLRLDLSEKQCKECREELVVAQAECKALASGNAELLAVGVHASGGEVEAVLSRDVTGELGASVKGYGKRWEEVSSLEIPPPPRPPRDVWVDRSEPMDDGSRATDVRTGGVEAGQMVDLAERHDSGLVPPAPKSPLNVWAGDEAGRALGDSRIMTNLPTLPLMHATDVDADIGGGASYAVDAAMFDSLRSQLSVLKTAVEVRDSMLADIRYLLEEKHREVAVLLLERSSLEERLADGLLRMKDLSSEVDRLRAEVPGGSLEERLGESVGAGVLRSSVEGMEDESVCRERVVALASDSGVEAVHAGANEWLVDTVARLRIDLARVEQDRLSLSEALEVTRRELAERRSAIVVETSSAAQVDSVSALQLAGDTNVMVSSESTNEVTDSTCDAVSVTTTSSTTTRATTVVTTTSTIPSTAARTTTVGPSTITTTMDSGADPSARYVGVSVGGVSVGVGVGDGDGDGDGDGAVAGVDASSSEESWEARVRELTGDVNVLQGQLSERNGLLNGALEELEMAKTSLRLLLGQLRVLRSGYSSESDVKSQWALDERLLEKMEDSVCRAGELDDRLRVAIVDAVTAREDLNVATRHVGELSAELASVGECKNSLRLECGRLSSAVMRRDEVLDGVGHELNVTRGDLCRALEEVGMVRKRCKDWRTSVLAEMRECYSGVDVAVSAVERMDSCRREEMRQRDAEVAELLVEMEKCRCALEASEGLVKSLSEEQERLAGELSEWKRLCESRCEAIGCLAGEVERVRGELSVVREERDGLLARMAACEQRVDGPESVGEGEKTEVEAVLKAASVAAGGKEAFGVVADRYGECVDMGVETEETVVCDGWSTYVDEALMSSSGKQEVAEEKSRVVEVSVDASGEGRSVDVGIDVCIGVDICMEGQHGLGVENAVVLEGVDSVVEEHASIKLDLRGVSEKTGLEKKLAEVSGEVDRLKHELEEKDRELVTFLRLSRSPGLSLVDSSSSSLFSTLSSGPSFSIDPACHSWSAGSLYLSEIASLRSKISSLCFEISVAYDFTDTVVLLLVNVFDFLHSLRSSSDWRSSLSYCHLLMRLRSLSLLRSDLLGFISKSDFMHRVSCRLFQNSNDLPCSVSSPLCTELCANHFAVKQFFDDDLWYRQLNSLPDPEYKSHCPSLLPHVATVVTNRPVLVDATSSCVFDEDDRQLFQAFRASSVATEGEKLEFASSQLKQLKDVIAAQEEECDQLHLTIAELEWHDAEKQIDLDEAVRELRAQSAELESSISLYLEKEKEYDAVCKEKYVLESQYKFLEKLYHSDKTIHQEVLKELEFAREECLKKEKELKDGQEEIVLLKDAAQVYQNQLQQLQLGYSFINNECEALRSDKEKIDAAQQLLRMDCEKLRKAYELHCTGAAHQAHLMEAHSHEIFSELQTLLQNIVEDRVSGVSRSDQYWDTVECRLQLITTKLISATSGYPPEFTGTEASSTKPILSHKSNCAQYPPTSESIQLKSRDTNGSLSDRSPSFVNLDKGNTATEKNIFSPLSSSNTTPLSRFVANICSKTFWSSSEGLPEVTVKECGSLDALNYSEDGFYLAVLEYIHNLEQQDMYNQSERTRLTKLLSSLRQRMQTQDEVLQELQEATLQLQNRLSNMQTENMLLPLTSSEGERLKDISLSLEAVSDSGLRVCDNQAIETKLDEDGLNTKDDVSPLMHSIQSINMGEDVYPSPLPCEAFVSYTDGKQVMNCLSCGVSNERHVLEPQQESDQVSRAQVPECPDHITESSQSPISTRNPLNHLFRTLQALCERVNSATCDSLYLPDDLLSPEIAQPPVSDQLQSDITKLADQILAGVDRLVICSKQVADDDNRILSLQSYADHLCDQLDELVVRNEDKCTRLFNLREQLDAASDLLYRHSAKLETQQNSLKTETVPTNALAEGFARDDQVGAQNAENGEALPGSSQSDQLVLMEDNLSEYKSILKQLDNVHIHYDASVNRLSVLNNNLRSASDRLATQSEQVADVEQLNLMTRSAQTDANVHLSSALAQARHDYERAIERITSTEAELDAVREQLQEKCLKLSLSEETIANWKRKITALLLPMCTQEDEILSEEVMPETAHDRLSKCYMNMVSELICLEDTCSDLRCQLEEVDTERNTVMANLKDLEEILPEMPQITVELSLVECVKGLLQYLRQTRALDTSDHFLEQTETDELPELQEKDNPPETDINIDLATMVFQEKVQCQSPIVRGDQVSPASLELPPEGLVPSSVECHLKHLPHGRQVKHLSESITSMKECITSLKSSLSVGRAECSSILENSLQMISRLKSHFEQCFSEDSYSKLVMMKVISNSNDLQDELNSQGELVIKDIIRIQNQLECLNAKVDDRNLDYDTEFSTGLFSKSNRDISAAQPPAPYTDVNSNIFREFLHSLCCLVGTKCDSEFLLKESQMNSTKLTKCCSEVLVQVDKLVSFPKHDGKSFPVDRKVFNSMIDFIQNLLVLYNLPPVDQTSLSDSESLLTSLDKVLLQCQRHCLKPNHTIDQATQEDFKNQSLVNLFDTLIDIIERVVTEVAVEEPCVENLFRELTQNGLQPDKLYRLTQLLQTHSQSTRAYQPQGDSAEVGKDKACQATISAGNMVGNDGGESCSLNTLLSLSTHLRAFFGQLDRLSSQPVVSCQKQLNGEGAGVTVTSASARHGDSTTLGLQELVTVTKRLRQQWQTLESRRVALKDHSQQTDSALINEEVCPTDMEVIMQQFGEEEVTNGLTEMITHLLGVSEETVTLTDASASKETGTSWSGLLEAENDFVATKSQHAETLSVGIPGKASSLQRRVSLRRSISLPVRLDQIVSAISTSANLESVQSLTCLTKQRRRSKIPSFLSLLSTLERHLPAFLMHRKNVETDQSVSPDPILQPMVVREALRQLRQLVVCCTPSSEFEYSDSHNSVNGNLTIAELRIWEEIKHLRRYLTELQRTKQWDSREYTSEQSKLELRLADFVRAYKCIQELLPSRVPLHPGGSTRSLNFQSSDTIQAVDGTCSSSYRDTEFLLKLLSIREIELRYLMQISNLAKKPHSGDGFICSVVNRDDDATSELLANLLYAFKNWENVIPADLSRLPMYRLCVETFVTDNSETQQISNAGHSTVSKGCLSEVGADSEATSIHQLVNQCYLTLSQLKSSPDLPKTQPELISELSKPWISILHHMLTSADPENGASLLPDVQETVQGLLSATPPSGLQHPHSSPGYPRRPSCRLPIAELLSAVDQLTDLNELRSLAKYLLDQYHVLSSELELQLDTNWSLRQKLVNANAQIDKVTRLLGNNQHTLARVEERLSLEAVKHSELTEECDAARQHARRTSKLLEQLQDEDRQRDLTPVPAPPPNNWNSATIDRRSVPSAEDIRPSVDGEKQLQSVLVHTSQHYSPSTYKFIPKTDSAQTEGKSSRLSCFPSLGCGQGRRKRSSASLVDISRPPLPVHQASTSRRLPKRAADGHAQGRSHDGPGLTSTQPYSCQSNNNNSSVCSLDASIGGDQSSTTSSPLRNPRENEFLAAGGSALTASPLSCTLSGSGAHTLPETIDLHELGDSSFVPLTRSEPTVRRRFGSRSPERPFFRRLRKLAGQIKSRRRKIRERLK